VIVLRRFGSWSIALLLLGAVAITGCGVDTKAIDDAYAKGYADGVAAVQDELPGAESPYWEGYQDGLADCEGGETQDTCQRCYGQGFSDGYEAGLTAAE